MTAQPDVAAESGKKPGAWRRNVLIIGGTIAYMIPLFWLWNRTGYPESFGFRITAHGRVGLLENWYYSYDLIRRHHPWDVVAFIYMWALVVGIVAWLVSLAIQDWKTKRARRAEQEGRS